MMYERFGGRPINPARVESGNAIPVIGTGDVLAALVDLSDTELEHMTIADKIYTCMIEVKYKNNDLKLASWLKEAELVNGGYSILSAKEYDIYMKAYQKAFQLYGQDTANDTLLDYGCVLTPDIFESKKSFNEALNDFARTIRSHFGDSSFYHNRDNANYVARSYMMAKKMCENSQFADITDIYACDMDVVSHTYGYDSSNIILLADTQVVQLNDSYGEDCDTDQDGINDNVEAHTPEEVDITNFLKEYCKYNKYTPEETADTLAKNSKVVMYNYSSNPVLPDSDFDGRDDLRDGRKLDNEYNSTNETDNYSNIKIKFNQDYRYFFMESTQYYEELAEMGLILSNMASKKKNNNNIYVNKKWTNNNSGEHYTANNINDFMWYIGMDQIQNHMEENVPYIIGQHDVIALLGKVNNLERNVITLVIGENENYKDILAANYDGSLGSGSGEDIHHQGYDYHAQQIYEQLVNYDNNQIADRWKKSYWIVGYGTGGSVANLVAKKFIDYKHVNTNVYCYTYQAPGTINRSKLEKRIYNVKYQSIFNVFNSSDYMMQLDEIAKFSRYGKIKQSDVGFSKKHNGDMVYAFSGTGGIMGVLKEIGLSITNNQEFKELIKSSYLYINDMFVNLGNYSLSAYKQVSSNIAIKLNEICKHGRSIDKLHEVAVSNAPIGGGDEILPDDSSSWNIREFLDSLFKWCEYFKGCGYESGKKPVTLDGKYNIKSFDKTDVNEGNALSDEDKQKIKFDCSGFIAGMYALASKDMRANNNSFINPAEDKLYFRYFYKKDKNGNEIKSESPTAVWRKYNKNYDGAYIDTKFTYAGTANQVAACKDNAIWVYNKDDTKDESIISRDQCKDTSKGNSISFKKYVEHYNEIYKKKYDKDPDTSLLSSDDDYNKIIKPGDLLFVTESPGHISIVKREVAEYNYDSKTYNNYTLEVWHSGTWDNVTKDEYGGKYEGVINSLFTGGAKDVADLYIEGIKENGDLVTSVPVYRYKTIAGNKTYYNNAYIFRVLNWEE